jgi:alpha-tubulin suppressor-like RCC1 family protein
VQTNVPTGFTSITQITAGNAHTCALTASGAVWCWGDNTFGQLGIGAASTTPKLVPTQVSITNVVQLSAGNNHTCAAKSDGSVWCWGDNSAGQIGDGSQTQRPSPTQVLSVGSSTQKLANVTSVAGGGLHSCAVLSNQSEVCWGSQASGQLGNGTTSTTPATRPVTVKNVANTGSLASVKGIATGGSHSCANLDSASTVCWGSDGSGQLGNGAAGSSNIPSTVSLTCP